MTTVRQMSLSCTSDPLILGLLWHLAETEFQAAQDSIARMSFWRRAWQDSLSEEVIIRPPDPCRESLAESILALHGVLFSSFLPHPALSANIDQVHCARRLSMTVSFLQMTVLFLFLTG